MDVKMGFINQLLLVGGFKHGFGGFLKIWHLKTKWKHPISHALGSNFAEVVLLLHPNAWPSLAIEFHNGIGVWLRSAGRTGPPSARLGTMIRFTKIIRW